MAESDSTLHPVRNRIDIRKMRELVSAGYTAMQLVSEFGVSRAAIHQSAKKMRLTAAIAANTAALRVKPPTKTEMKYELSPFMIRHYRALGLTKAFTQQRQNASNRGLGWELTFAQWAKLWEDSGKWALRGVIGKGEDRYEMARPGDVGPYAIGNVVICTHKENMQEVHAGMKRRREEQKQFTKSYATSQLNG